MYLYTDDSPSYIQKMGWSTPMLDYTEFPFPELAELKFDVGDIDQIWFYNPFGIGDLHVSRGFIKDMKSQLPDKKFGYQSIRHPYFLEDLQLNWKWKQQTSPIEGKNVFDRHEPEWRGGSQCPLRNGMHSPYEFHSETRTLWVNTWYHAPMDYVNFYGEAVFPIIWAKFRELYHYLDLDFNDDDPTMYYPDIDFSFYQTGLVDDLLKNTNFESRILVCNEDVNSDQVSVNFNLQLFLKDLIEKHKDKQFIFTRKKTEVPYREGSPANLGSASYLNELSHASIPFIPMKADNVFYTDDIFSELSGVSLPDVNEIAYLSTHCDVVIGRSSGCHTFTLIKPNILDDKKKFISFVRSEHLSQWAPHRKNACYSNMYNHEGVVKNMVSEVLETL